MLYTHMLHADGLQGVCFLQCGNKERRMISLGQVVSIAIILCWKASAEKYTLALQRQLCRHPSWVERFAELCNRNRNIVEERVC